MVNSFREPKTGFLAGEGAHALLLLVVGSLVGWLAWGRGPDVALLGWILVLPLAWGMARSRGSAAALVAGYYLAGARGLPGGAVVFFGDAAPAWIGWCMWVLANALLTVPFLLLWTKQESTRPWRFVAAACCSAIPPLAFIGWLSPLAVAGLAFPALGWVGLILTFALMAAMVAKNLRWITALAVLACFANGALYFGPTKALPAWQGINTEFAKLSSAGAGDAAQLLSTMRRVQWVAQFAKTVPPNSVRVLPETILGSFDGVADFALQETGMALASRGSRLLVGVELPQANGQYKNAVMVLGADHKEDRVAVQNTPVPFGMWKPWAPDGAVANVFGRTNLITVNELRVGVVVCYEQVLAYSLLWLLMERTEVIAAVSNVWWARETSIPAILEQTVNAFGRLFGVPVIAAKNT